MVKSPWKLLTGLLSRGKTAEHPSAGQSNLPKNSNEVDGSGGDSTASEAATVSEPVPEPESLAGSQTGKGETELRQERSPSDAADAPGTPVTDERVEIDPDRTVEIIGAKRRNRREKAPSVLRGTVTTETPINTSNAKPAVTRAKKVVKNIPDPVLTLDSEVRDLRSQLESKLRLQNDQLRQMLERFQSK